MDVDDGVEVKPFQILAIIGAEKCNISVWLCEAVVAILIKNMLWL
jgi:hypothetical protein